MLACLRIAPSRAPALTAIAALAALAFTFAIAGCGGSPRQGQTTGASEASTPSASGFDGAALPGGIGAPAFTLHDSSGTRVSLRSYHGRVVILAFLYSTCGSPCVLIAQQIRGALDELPHPVPVLIVSVDPRADTPANIRRFLAAVSLSGRARYLTGSATQLRAVGSAYRVKPPSAGRAAFARSTPIVLIDRAGNERVLYELEQLTPESVSHDVRVLLG
jgi:protein SCO1/2